MKNKNDKINTSNTYKKSSSDFSLTNSGETLTPNAKQNDSSREKKHKDRKRNINIENGVTPRNIASIKNRENTAVEKNFLKDSKRTDKFPNSEEQKPLYPKRVGILIENFMNGIVKSEVPNAFEDIFIERKNLNGAPFNMKVVCSVIDAPPDYEMRGRQYYYNSQTGFGMAKGSISEVLGEVGANDPTISGILISHGISMEFPDKVKDFALSFKTDLTKEEIESEILSGRIDRRSENIITIDGEDAKDLDDAISVQKKENGNFLLGVHIADVTHYVIEGNPIDEEAGKRGTSVYLVDRVIPMLPQILSNGLCSLHPGKPKFALSVIMEWSHEGELVEVVFTKSVIESKERFTYNEVYKMLGDKKEIIEKLEKHRSMLETMLELTTILRTKRFERGAINFEFPETKVKLDIDKTVISVFAAPITFANEMIEECMIACNEAVAEKFALLKAPFIYRVHEQPDSEKMDRFIKVAKLFGEKIHFSPNPKSIEINKAISQIEKTPYGNTLMQLLLRSMAKARYASKCLGHFGLASTFYCHFTSPIRRYPDLFIHRVVKAYINKNKFPTNWIKQSEIFSEISSDTERNAMLAERESVDFKTAEYMEKFVGVTFEGRVSGLFNAGVFVQLENTIEGFAPFRNMDSFYEYDENQMIARSNFKNITIRIGDMVKVKVFKADRISRRVEFLLDETSLHQEISQKRARKSQQNNKFTKNKSINNNSKAFSPNGKKTKAKSKSKGKPKTKSRKK